MPSDIKLLIDEDTHLALAEGRRRGYDAVHVREVERLGKDDIDQLQYAVEQKRSFITFNMGEFVVWHGAFVRSGREHCGVIVSAQKPLGPLLRETLAFLQSHTAAEVRNQLWFL